MVIVKKNKKPIENGDEMISIIIKENRENVFLKNNIKLIIRVI